MRAIAPHISMLLLVLQLATAGLLGPRLLCVHRDGSHSIELAVTTCCRAEQSCSIDEDRCGGCGGESDRDPSRDGQTYLSGPGCDCVDVPMADEPVVRQAPQSVALDQLAMDLALVAVAVPLVDAAWHEPARWSGAHLLPDCLAPPRAHIATIILRI